MIEVKSSITIIGKIFHGSCLTRQILNKQFWETTIVVEKFYSR